MLVVYSRLSMWVGRLIFGIIVFILTGSEAARILAYFPTPSISHQVVYRPLYQELARRGHEVTVITTDPAFPKGKTPANLIEIDVHNISYSNWHDIFMYSRGKKTDILKQIILIFERFATIADLQLQTPQVQEVMKKDSKYYDLLILEACNRVILGLSKKFDAPIIHASSFGAIPPQYHFFGAPYHPLLYPTPGRQRLYNLTMLEKAGEIFKGVALDFFIKYTEDYDRNIIIKHFGYDIPNAEFLKNKISMLFLNEHQIWADNHPVPPNILYLGGIHQPISRELPKDLKNYLDSSKNGVIYVSFGTNVQPSLLPPEKILIMTRVFSKLPYDILWKWDKEELPEQPKNVKILKWFPQADLLKHPKIKLFITQGGLQSTDETIDAGVPVLGIPMLGDQWYNVEKFVHHDIGLQLDMQTMTEEDFKHSLETVINDSRFRNNIQRLRSLMREHPIKPLDTAVWWAEHIIKYGGAHLQSPAAFMSWMEYFEIKLVISIITILSVILIALIYVLKMLSKLVYMTICGRSNTKIKRQ